MNLGKFLFKKVLLEYNNEFKIKKSKGSIKEIFGLSKKEIYLKEKQQIKDILDKYKKECLSLAYQVIEFAEQDMKNIEAGIITNKSSKLLNSVIDSAKKISLIQNKYNPNTADIEDIGKKITPHFKNKLNILKRDFSSKLDSYLNSVSEISEEKLDKFDKQLNKAQNDSIKKSKKEEFSKTLKGRKVAINNNISREINALDIKYADIPGKFVGTQMFNSFLIALFAGDTNQEILNLSTELIS